MHLQHFGIFESDFIYFFADVHLQQNAYLYARQTSAYYRVIFKSMLGHQVKSGIPGFVSNQA